MKIPLRDFLCQTERQMIMRACERMGLKMELKTGQVKNHKGHLTRTLSYYLISREELMSICESYLTKYKAKGHYSSLQAYKRHLKNVEQFDKYMEKIKETL